MASRKEIFRLKLAIEEDGKLGHGSRALGLRVCSYIYNHAQHRFQPDEPFPLSWTLCSQLGFGMSKRQAYRSLKELHDRGHMIHCGVMGCPGKAHFKLMIPEKKVTDRGAFFGTPRCDKNGTSRSAKNGSPRGAMNRSPLISNSFQEGIVNPKEEIRGGSAAQGTKEDNGSLRSKGTNGEQQPASPGSVDVPFAERAAKFRAALKKEPNLN